MTRFLGINCFGFARREIAELEACMEILLAEEEIRAGEVPDERVYDLVLAATGSEERASDALEGRIAWRLKNGRKGA